MCILIYKPAGKRMPPVENMLNCWLSNPDGAGMAWCDGARTFLRKGFLQWESFKYFYEESAPSLTNKDVIIHFRFATHGSVKPANCHPFVVSSRISDLQRVNYSGTDMILAHNGVITGYDYSRKTVNDLSDTMLFTKKVFTYGLEDTEVKRILNIGKFCVMTVSGVTKHGHFIEDEGIFYSNSTYRVDYITRISTYADQYNKAELVDAVKCAKSRECSETGICIYNNTDIENEMLNGDVVFCPLAADYNQLVSPFSSWRKRCDDRIPYYSRNKAGCAVKTEVPVDKGPVNSVDYRKTNKSRVNRLKENTKPAEDTKPIIDVKPSVINKPAVINNPSVIPAEATKSEKPAVATSKLLNPPTIVAKPVITTPVVTTPVVTKPKVVAPLNKSTEKRNKIKNVYDYILDGYA